MKIKRESCSCSSRIIISISSRRKPPRRPCIEFSGRSTNDTCRWDMNAASRPVYMIMPAGVLLHVVPWHHSTPLYTLPPNSRCMQRVYHTQNKFHHADNKKIALNDSRRVFIQWSGFCLLPPTLWINGFFGRFIVYWMFTIDIGQFSSPLCWNCLLLHLAAAWDWCVIWRMLVRIVLHVSKSLSPSQNYHHEILLNACIKLCTRHVQIRKR